MEEIQKAKEELKRIDHLIYVTLKYTRTVDVFLSIVDRMINSYEFLVEALGAEAVAQGKTFDMSDVPLEKANQVMKLYDSKTIKDNLQKYLMFRRLRRAQYEKSNEFRRHVTMSSLVDGKVVQVTIDSITEDFHKLKNFIEYIEKKLQK